MQAKFGRILVPTEEVVELKNGKKAVTERRFFPGYVLVEMLTWTTTPGTWSSTPARSPASSAARKNRPAPISEAEVDKIVNQMQEGVDKPRPKVEWKVGELVRVKEGPFTDFNGAVEEVNYEKSQGARLGHDLRPCDTGRARFRSGRKGLRTSVRRPFAGLARPSGRQDGAGCGR